MMNSLKHVRKNIGRGLSRTWDHISEGWRELAHQSSDALTHFTRRKDADHGEASYKNGVLTVRLPKVGGEQGRLIPIS